MAVPDHSIDPRIIESARKEFLEKGFEKASLKSICEGAPPAPSTSATKARRTCSAPLYGRPWRSCTLWRPSGGTESFPSCPTKS